MFNSKEVDYKLRVSYRNEIKFQITKFAGNTNTYFTL